jgi:hypothetical protein
MHRICAKSCRLVALLLCQLLVLEPVLAEVPNFQNAIRVVVVEGNGARNVVQQIPARPLTVRVEDTSGTPISGATVVFTAPEGGPSGEFPSGSNTLTIITNDNGLAIAGGYHPNGFAGSYQIQVRAEARGQTATTAISQSNVTQQGGRGKWLTILTIAGAAVGAGIAVHSFRNNRSTPTETTPTISLGGTSVGAPRQ